MKRDALIRAPQQFTAPLNRRLRLLLQRSVLTRVKHSGSVRLLQIKKPGGEDLADIEHLEPFGFTSHAKPGAEAIVLAFNGNGSHSVALLVGDRKYRLEVSEGDTAIYNANGDHLHLKADGSAEMKSSTKVTINTPLTEIKGALNVAGVVVMQNTLTVAGAAIMQSTLSAAGMATFAAGATINGVSFSGHYHQYTDDGNSRITGGPQS